MKSKHECNLIAAALALFISFAAALAHAADPLPSWSDGPAKKSIVEFVGKVTTAGSPHFVPVHERIAVFETTARCGVNSRCLSNCISHSIA